MRQLYDASGQVLATSRYDPYGSLMSHSGEATSVFGFTGEQWDAATGLEYLRARYYSSAQGRFVTRDVWAGDPNAPMSYNAWNYTSGNPVNYVDPTGLQGCTTEGICPPPPHPAPSLPPKTPTLPPDSTMPAGVGFAMYLQDYTEKLRALQQALNDPHPISLYELYPGDSVTREALLDIWFDIHCDYDPLYDFEIEEYWAERGWIADALKLDLRHRWGLWKIQREPGNLAGIQGIVAGVAFVGAQDEANKLANLGVQMPWTKVTKANGFAAWTEQLYLKMKVNKALTLTKEQTDILVLRARTYSVQLKLEPGHATEPMWDMPHLHIGDERYHVRVPNGYTLPP